MKATSLNTDMTTTILGKKTIVLKILGLNKFLVLTDRLSFFFSNHSYGSHKNRPFKDESHKGSLETLDGEEKKDASKEDLEGERGETGRALSQCGRVHYAWRCL